MAYAFVAKNDAAATGSSATITLSVTYATGDYVLVRASCASSTTTATAADGTNTYTQQGTGTVDTNGPQRYYDFYCKAPVAGTYTLTITFSPATSFRSVAYVRYSGLDNTATPATAVQFQANPAATTDAVTSTTATPASQPAAVIGVTADMTSGTVPTFTQGTGFTSQGPMTNTDTTFTGKSMWEDKRVTSTSAVAATWTSSTATSHDVSRVWIIPEASASGSTGTIAVTNANDTSAASGTTTVKGSSATTNANDTSAASGTTKIVGSIATTNADDASAASGSVGAAVTGTIAVTNANDTSSAAGTTKILGVSATTNANDTSAASGTTRIVGTISVTNANDTSAASGQAGAVTGTITYVNNNDISSASGTAGTGRSQGGGRGRKATDDDWREFAEYKDALRQARVELKKPKPSVAKVERAVEALVTPAFDVPDIETRIEDFRALEGIEDLSEKFQRVVREFQLMLEDEDDVEMLLH